MYFRQHIGSIKAKGAAGIAIKLENYLATFSFKCENYSMEIVDAVVAQSGPENIILLGLIG